MRCKYGGPFRACERALIDNISIPLKYNSFKPPVNPSGGDTPSAYSASEYIGTLRVRGDH